jgi:hypothetical protein
MHLLLAAVLLAAPPPAPATGSGADGGDRPRMLGLSVSAGAPQGFGLAGVLRPLPWLRASAGVAHNVLGLGVQGSVTAFPAGWAVTPTFTLEGGRFFETDVSDDFSGTFPSAFDPSLRRFGYSFWSAQVGVELGARRSFLFFLRGGLAWVRSGLDGVQGYVPDDAPDTTVDVSDVTLRAVVPTLNLGAVFFLW